MTTKDSKVAKVPMELLDNEVAIMAKAKMNLPVACGEETETKPPMDQTNLSLEAITIGITLEDLPPVVAVDLGEITAVTQWVAELVAMEV